MQHPAPFGGGGVARSHARVSSPSPPLMGVNALRTPGTFRSGFVSSPSPPPLMLSPKIASTTGAGRPMLIRPTTVKVGFPPPTQPRPQPATTAHGGTSYTPTQADWLSVNGNQHTGFVPDSHLTPLRPQRNRVPSPSVMTPQQRHSMIMQQATHQTISPHAASGYPVSPSNISVPSRYGASTNATDPFRFTGTQGDGLYRQQEPPVTFSNTMKFIHEGEVKSDTVWNTPGFFTSSPVCSPLTIDGAASTAWLDYESSNTAGPQSSFGFVPIDAGANRESPFPTSWVSTASNARSLVSPLNLHDESFKAGEDDDDDEYKHEEELMLMMSTAADEDPLPGWRFESPTTPVLKSADSSSPYKFGLQAGKQQHAPSPALTAETESDMTMDQSAYSGSIHAKKPFQRNHLDFISTPPVYQKSIVKTSPPMSSLAAAAAAGRSHSVAAIVTNPAVKKPSSLAAAATAGRGNTVRGINQSYLHSGQTTVTLRPQSAPTLGRSTVSSGSSTVSTHAQSAKATKDEDALQRKSRLKTELCLHYLDGRPCPFGQNCTYAHGEEELQMTKLLDLHEAGLVDMETYRTKPCLSWISTGSCPFGKRCTGIHDHRVVTTSVSPSWLPHTETQGNTIATDINVDGLHQKRLHSILYDNPFGDQFTISSDTNPVVASTYNDLFGFVCGDATDRARRAHTKDGWIAGGCVKRGRYVHPIYKLQIALKLRGTESDWMYKYRPQHIVNEELCMVLQKRAFRVISNDHSTQNGQKNQANRGGSSSSATSTSSVVEIALNEYNPRLSGQILVHEIAFGPDSDPSVRGLALWFNISESDVTVCTPQQAKRFRWKKTTCNTQASKKNVRDEREGYTAGAFDHESDSSAVSTKPSVFDSGAIDSFPMIRPHDEAAFRLTTEMMKHRLAVLKREHMSGMKDRFDALPKLQRQEEWLVDRFENHRRMWAQWAWPVNQGRTKVDRNTPVPSVEGPYVVEQVSKGARAGCKRSADQDQDELGHHVRPVWNSFVETFLNEPKQGPKPSGGKSKRLAVFEHLAQGHPIDKCRVLPHIIKHCSTKTKRAQGEQQERCWKALLLKPASPLERNEWDIVREHFENSRSKKVLTILQQ